MSSDSADNLAAVAPVHSLRNGTSALTPAALAAAVARADPHAAAELWDRYAPRVRRLARRTFAEDAVDDVVQDTFMAVFRGIAKLREPDRLEAYVVAVATNVLRMELRRRGRRRERATAPQDMPERGAAASQPAQRALLRLDAILSDLSPELRLAFVLRHVERMALDEVADALGCSLATAKRRLAKARRLVHRRAERDPVLSHYLAPTRASSGDEP